MGDAEESQIYRKSHDFCIMEEGVSSRAPPPKPKRTVLQSSAEVEEGFSEHTSPVRRNRNMAAARTNESPPHTPTYVPTQRGAKVPIIDAEAETTIGAAVKMRGELSFERLLRIEGEFDGKLVSKGSLVVGTKGCLLGDVDSMKEVFITGGKIVGNIAVEKVVLRDKASVFGNITAKSIKVDPDCVIVGTLNVHPQAPQVIDENGEVTD
uniref:Uncharacterized protein AlNc14C3G400 n=1 Tax=Albugo laibachii Nc14 TaxID=890382 RepID=F0VZS1_9STRA|nr:conserved hypothetical protein [Albugo laibachii Nc14]|eukprot:CCA14292.1 conserved hypothetical protein [Albugo laibachii Nc14]